MDNYMRDLIIVDSNDRIIGSMKALEAHKTASLTLHRAFSVFLFDSQNGLILQKRSDEKLVYPGLWSNTCCSHPFISEYSFNNQVDDIKNFALSRLDYEMGISEGIILKDELIFIDRILYKASENETFAKNIGKEIYPQEIFNYNTGDYVKIDKYSSKDFAEYEIDYILAIKKDVKIKPNPNEVSDYRSVNCQELLEMISSQMTTPWLSLITQKINLYSLFE